MAVSIFSDEQVFANEEINIWLNIFLDTLVTSFGQPTIDSSFPLTGSVAKIIQGDPAAEIKVVPFITDDDDIFDYCATKLPIGLKCTAVALEDVIQIQYQGIYIEVWKGVLGTINDENGLKVQDPADIPANIL